MFITEQDYKVIVGDAALKVISQADVENRANAEAEAIEEISGYLRPKYDCEAIFATEGKNRPRQLVMYATDIAVYHMMASMPQKMGSEVRKERYDRAIKWLEGVQAGKIVPDFPLATSTDGTTTHSDIIYSSEPKLRHTW